MLTNVLYSYLEGSIHPVVYQATRLTAIINIIIPNKSLIGD